MRTFRNVVSVLLVLAMLFGCTALAAVTKDDLQERVGITEEEAVTKYGNTIKRGSYGKVVKAAQAALIELGYLDDVADGAYGNKTKAAIQLFEEEQDLIVDGELEPLEIHYLLACGPMTRDEVKISKAQVGDVASVKAALEVLPVRVTSAKVLVQSKLNKEVYPDMLTAVVRNTTSKTITGYTVGFLAYDENGIPVEILTQYDEEGYYEILGDAVGVTVAANSSFGSSYGWRLQDDHGIVNLIACVQSVTFENGTEWENPIYSVWKETFAEKQLDASMMQ